MPSSDLELQKTPNIRKHE